MAVRPGRGKQLSAVGVHLVASTPAVSVAGGELLRRLRPRRRRLGRRRAVYRHRSGRWAPQALWRERGGGGVAWRARQRGVCRRGRRLRAVRRCGGRKRGQMAAVAARGLRAGVLQAGVRRVSDGRHRRVAGHALHPQGRLHSLETRPLPPLLPPAGEAHLGPLVEDHGHRGVPAPAPGPGSVPGAGQLGDRPGHRAHGEADEAGGGAAAGSAPGRRPCAAGVPPERDSQAELPEPGGRAQLPTGRSP
mmetsp:Transcript_12544/g.46380  ORF Transcript_12544/g.46380 Transcript_12544/m.46380 type:complete len:248 (+) Transcript_12544:221-964(+)